MNLKDKFSIIYKIISSMKGNQKRELLQAYQELKETFAQSIFLESLTETLDRLKSNLVYKKLDLEIDSDFFKGILNKIDDPLVYNELLEIAPTLKCSDAERKVLDQQFPKFELFFEFSKVLKEKTGFFYEVYSNNLYQLHGIIFSEKIKYEDIKWFLKSPFFELISESSTSFKESINKIFSFLLKNTCYPLKSEEIFSLKIEKFEKMNQKTLINHNMLFYNVPFIGKNLSPIAKDAMQNSLKEYIAPTIFKH